MQVAFKATEFGRLMQNKAIMLFKVMQSRVANFGAIWKFICDFLLVNNINLQLHPIWRHFQVIVDYWSNFWFCQGYLSLTHTFGLNSTQDY